MRRYLLKFSGEALGGEGGFGIEPDVLERICAEVADLMRGDVQLGVVLGGGNLFRGQNLAARGMDRVAGDRMGMLATVMNGIAFSDFLHQQGVANKLYSAMPMPGVTEGYNRDHALSDMREGKVVILTGGTANPFFTTDSAACLRGIELGVDAVLKATNVDGIYSADPKLEPDAQKFDVISYDEVLARSLRVMDLTAIVLCKEHDMPLVVFDMQRAKALVDIANGVKVGTRVIAEVNGAEATGD